MTDMEFAAAMMDLRPGLVRMGKSLCRDAERAEDLASAAVARGWQHRGRFEPGSNLRAWLSMILRNLFLTEQRRKKWDGGHVEDIDGLVIPTPASQEDAFHLRDLGNTLDLIPPDQRAAVIAVALEGDYEAAAAATGVAPGTIKSRVSRGRRLLRDLLA